MKFINIQNSINVLFKFLTQLTCVKFFRGSLLVVQKNQKTSLFSLFLCEIKTIQQGQIDLILKEY